MFFMTYTILLRTWLLVHNYINLKKKVFKVIILYCIKLLISGHLVESERTNIIYPKLSDPNPNHYLHCPWMNLQFHLGGGGGRGIDIFGSWASGFVITNTQCEELRYLVVVNIIYSSLIIILALFIQIYGKFMT